MSDKKEENHLILNLVKQVKNIGYQLSLGGGGIDETNLVHKTFDETIHDFKTFTEIVTASGFKVPLGTGSQFLKANGTMDSTVYAPDLNVIHKSGDEVKTGRLTVNAIIKAGGLPSEYLMADGGVSRLTNPATGFGTTNYLSKWISSSELSNSKIYDNGTSVLVGTTVDKGFLFQVAGDIFSQSFVKDGGTAAQFLKADGSIDSTLYEDASNKQNSMAVDGLGIKFPTVDAVNFQTNYIARALAATGFIDTSDSFRLYKVDEFTLGVGASQFGIVFSEKFKQVPYAPSDGMVNLTQRTIPLASIGLSGIGTSVLFVGYRLSDNAITFSENQYIQSNSVCQLGIIMVKYEGGITSFVDDSRTTITMPDVSAYNNLLTTAVGLEPSMSIAAVSGTLSHSNPSGTLIGISVGWGTTNNDLLFIASNAVTPFTRLSPGNKTSAVPPAIVTTLDPKVWWNGTALVTTGNPQSASVQRLLLTVHGTFAWQYGELAYQNLVAAQNNVLQAPFTNVLPAGTFAEVGRMAIQNNCTDLDSALAQYYPTGSGGSGGGGSSAASFSTITGDPYDNDALADALDTKIDKYTDILGHIPRSIGNQALGNSQIYDNGSRVTIAVSDNFVDKFQVGGSIIGTSIKIVGGLSNQFLKANGSIDSNTYQNIAQKGQALGYAPLDNNAFVPMKNLPPSALERLYVVADEAARFALTTAQVQEGDTVKQNDTEILYLVKDESNLDSELGYEVYKAGAASTVPWSGVTDTPTTVEGYGITDIDDYVVFKTDIQVVLSGGKSLGKYTNGQTIPAIGKTFEQVMKDIAMEYLNPVFTSFSITGQSTIVEVGTTLTGSKTFTWGINQNSGTVPTIDIYNNTALTTLLAGTPNDNSQAQVITTIQLNADAATQSWKGIANNTNPPGAINSSNFVVTARYLRFWGPVSSYPGNIADGAGNRTYALALTNTFKTSGPNTFTMATGIIQNKWIVLLPPGVTITSVVDQTNANTDVTPNYILSTITINDIGGTPRTYNMYQYTTAIPYTVSANHFITTT